MKAVVRSPEPDNQANRLLIGMTTPPPPSQSQVNQRRSQGRMMRTLFDLIITDKMDGSHDHNQTSTTIHDNAAAADTDQNMMRWKSTLKQRMNKFKSIGCCCRGGGTDAMWHPTIGYDNNQGGNGVVGAVDVEQLRRQQSMADHQATTHLYEQEEDNVVPEARMNLAMVLAAEREFRAAVTEEETTEEMVEGRVSLMRLLEEDEKEKEKEENEMEKWCCVCMERRKGAAMVPCGHTYCRECCSQVLLSRGSCPLCNRPILDILHLY